MLKKCLSPENKEENAEESKMEKKKKIIRTMRKERG